MQSAGTRLVQLRLVFMLTVCLGAQGCFVPPGVDDDSSSTASGTSGVAGATSTSGVGAGSSSSGQPPECTSNADCAYLDKDDDVCTTAVCNYDYECEEQIVTGT